MAAHFYTSNFAPPFKVDESGAVIRVVVGAAKPPLDAELDTDLKDRLRAAISHSSLEEWLRTTTEPTNWERATPNNGFVTTLKRRRHADANGDAEVWAKCTLQLPVGLNQSYAVLLLDVVIQRNRTEVALRPQFTIRDLHRLLHALARAAVDEVSPEVFSKVYGGNGYELVGPNFEVNVAGGSLRDLVQVTRYVRPPDANDVPVAFIQTPAALGPHDLEARDRVLRRGIATMLRQLGFDGFESDVRALGMRENTMSGSRS